MQCLPHPRSKLLGPWPVVPAPVDPPSLPPVQGGRTRAGHPLHGHHPDPRGRHVPSLVTITLTLEVGMYLHW